MKLLVVSPTKPLDSHLGHRENTHVWSTLGCMCRYWGSSGSDACAGDSMFRSTRGTGWPAHLGHQGLSTALQRMESFDSFSCVCGHARVDFVNQQALGRFSQSWTKTNKCSGCQSYSSNRFREICPHQGLCGIIQCPARPWALEE